MVGGVMAFTLSTKVSSVTAIEYLTSVFMTFYILKFLSF